MVVRDWSVSLSREGFKIALIEVPLWATFVGFAYDMACHATRHVICCGGPEWFWNIPLGLPRRDSDGYLENSLGTALYHLSSRILRIRWDREKVRYETSVSDEVGKSLWGDELRFWEDEEIEDGGREGGSGTGD